MGVIKVNGIPKDFFNCIIQFIYSDHFYIKNSDMTFFIKLLIYADYFVLDRLVEICCNYLEKFIRCKNVLPLLLVAHAHNARQLENTCIHFISVHESEVVNHNAWKSFDKKASKSLKNYLIDRLMHEKQTNFVEISIEKFINRNTVTSLPAISSRRRESRP